MAWAARPDVRPRITMSLYWFAISTLAVWRVTHLLNVEDGPWSIFARLRRSAASAGPEWAQLLDCFYCLSLWTAAPLAFTLGSTWGERLLLWPALSAGSILIQRLTSVNRPNHASLAAEYYETPEDTHALLRTEENRVARASGAAD